MGQNNQRPPIPSKLPEDKSDPSAQNICILLNTAIKRAQREGPVDDMRLTLNQVIRAIAAVEQTYVDRAKLETWQEILRQLEVCFDYIKEKHPHKPSDPLAPKSWSTSWSGRDDNGVI